MRDEVWNRLATAKGFVQVDGKPPIELLLQSWYIDQEQSMFAIAVELECNPGTIKLMLDRFGIPIRPKREIPKIPVKELRNLSYEELMKRYKIGRTTVVKLKRSLRVTKDLR